MGVGTAEVVAMSLPKSQLLVTPEKYLAFEREAVERHEWLDGLIYAMAGESPQHSIICSNIKTRAVPIPARGLEGLFAYPDTMVVCGKPIFHDEHQDVIINPKVIVEVLSKSTSRYDHEEKFERYAGNKSLTDYLL